MVKQIITIITEADLLHLFCGGLLILNHRQEGVKNNIMLSKDLSFSNISTLTNRAEDKLEEQFGVLERDVI
jgi:hypothetical protein